MSDAKQHFEELLQESFEERKGLRPGQIVEGRVVKITEDAIYVDIGAKSEAILPVEEVSESDLEHLQEGDPVRVKIISRRGGDIKVSKRQVDYQNALLEAQRDKQEGNLVTITIERKVKKGYEVSAYGGLLRGFIHEKSFPFDKPKVGEQRQAHLVEIERDRGDDKRFPHRLFFSRKELVLQEKESRLQQEFDSLQEGMIIEGEVESLTDYGAFVKVTENLTGLLHVSELSWNRVNHPKEVLKPGEKIRAKIIALDPEDRRISLSLKHLQTDPLLDIIEGEVYEGEVENVTDFGVFVKLPGGVTGLVHRSELTYRQFNHPGEIVQPGDKLQVKVKRVDIKERKVQLSSKDVEDDPWNYISEKYQVGQDVEVTATKLLDRGVIVTLDEYFDGFLPIGEIALERLNHPRERVKEGDKFLVRIIDIDPSSRRIKVSVRALFEKKKPAPKREEEAVEITAQEAKSEERKLTLGEVFKQEFEKLLGAKKAEEEEEQEEE